MPLPALLPALMGALEAMGGGAAAAGTAGAASTATTGAAATGAAASAGGAVAGARGMLGGLGTFGRVIEGMIPGTGNAHSLTSMLGSMYGENGGPETTSPKESTSAAKARMTEEEASRQAAANLKDIAARNAAAMTNARIQQAEGKVSKGGYSTIIKPPPSVQTMQKASELVMAGPSPGGWSSRLPPPPPPGGNQPPPGWSGPQPASTPPPPGKGLGIGNMIGAGLGFGVGNMLAQEVKSLLAQTIGPTIGALKSNVRMLFEPIGGIAERTPSMPFLPYDTEGGGSAQSVQNAVSEITNPFKALGHLVKGDLIKCFTDVIKEVEKFGEATVEAYRPLARYAPSLGMMFAQMDRQKMVLAGGYAQATSGSARMTGSMTMGLRQDIQPIAQMLGTFKNIGVGVLVTGVRALVQILTFYGRPLIMIAKWCEELMGAKTERAPIAVVMDAMARNQFVGPHNRRPGEP